MNDKFLRNAEEAKKGWMTFLTSINDAEAFKECFHLRPTSDRITIVSTLPYAPMRGIKVNYKELSSKLKELHNNLQQFLSCEGNAKNSALNTLGQKEFKKRSNANEIEECIQAKFIQGMIKRDPQYEKIEFVASELIVEKGRFDIVGVKDNTIYLFELKNRRTTAAFTQLRTYIDDFNVNFNNYMSVLKKYPNAPISAINSIRGVVVMPMSANSRTDWDKFKRENDLDIWFFDESLTLIK